MIGKFIAGTAAERVYPRLPYVVLAIAGAIVLLLLAMLPGPCS